MKDRFSNKNVLKMGPFVVKKIEVQIRRRGVYLSENRYQIMNAKGSIVVDRVRRKHANLLCEKYNNAYAKWVMVKGTPAEEFL